MRVLRQDGPGEPSYWQRHHGRARARHERDQRPAEDRRQGPHGRRRGVAPVAWECNCLEEVCGACTMVDQRPRRGRPARPWSKSCWPSSPDEIELRPMTKFPVRPRPGGRPPRLFRGLEKVKAWVPVDSYYDLGPGPRQSPQMQELAYPLEQVHELRLLPGGCPQYAKIELTRHDGRNRRGIFTLGRTRPTTRTSSAPTPSARSMLLQLRTRSAR